MGAFDYITCKYPLPGGVSTDRVFQTKDTPEPYQDSYEIREDGTLWHKEYDTEDRSDPNATGVLRLIGCATRVNQRWVFCDQFTGEIAFGDGVDEFSSYFHNGKLEVIHCINTGEKQ